MIDRIIAVLSSLPPWAVLGAVFLLPAVEAALFVGLVVPGETAVIVGGVLAHEGRVSLGTGCSSGYLNASSGPTMSAVRSRCSSGGAPLPSRWVAGSPHCAPSCRAWRG